MLTQKGKEHKKEKSKNIKERVRLMSGRPWSLEPLHSAWDTDSATPLLFVRPS